MINKVSIVPKPIIQAFEELKPLKSEFGHLITNDYDRSFFAPDFMKKLVFEYQCRYGRGHFLIPKMYMLMYRVVLKIPTLAQMVSVFDNDSDLQKACCFIGRYKIENRTLFRSNILTTSTYVNAIPSKRFKNLTRIYNLRAIQNNLISLYTEYQEALHNLADELNSKQITIDGIVPAIWVEYYRRPHVYKIRKKPESEIVSRRDFEAVFANNTGISIIDEITASLSLSYRSDVRQDIALRCFELGIDLSNKDAIAEITRQVMNRYHKDENRRRYSERSLFSKPFKDSETELWQTIVDPSADIEVELENQEIIRRHELEIIKVGDN